MNYRWLWIEGNLYIGIVDHHAELWPRDNPYHIGMNYAGGYYHPPLLTILYHEGNIPTDEQLITMIDAKILPDHTGSYFLATQATTREQSTAALLNTLEYMGKAIPPPGNDHWGHHSIGGIPPSENSFASESIGSLSEKFSTISQNLSDEFNHISPNGTQLKVKVYNPSDSFFYPMELGHHAWIYDEPNQTMHYMPNGHHADLVDQMYDDVHDKNIEYTNSADKGLYAGDITSHSGPSIYSQYDSYPLDPKDPESTGLHTVLMNLWDKYTTSPKTHEAKQWRADIREIETGKYNEGMKHRRPFIYMPDHGEDGTVYFGNAGAHHRDINDALGLNWPEYATYGGYYTHPSYTDGPWDIEHGEVTPALVAAMKMMPNAQIHEAAAAATPKVIYPQLVPSKAYTEGMGTPGDFWRWLYDPHDNELFLFKGAYHFDALEQILKLDEGNIQDREYNHWIAGTAANQVYQVYPEWERLDEDSEYAWLGKVIEKELGLPSAEKFSSITQKFLDREIPWIKLKSGEIFQDPDLYNHLPLLQKLISQGYTLGDIDSIGGGDAASYWEDSVKRDPGHLTSYIEEKNKQNSQKLASPIQVQFLEGSGDGVNRAVIYDPEYRTLYVGAKGMHHYDLMSQIMPLQVFDAHLEIRENGWVAGWIPPDSDYISYKNYGIPPDNAAEIDQALQQAAREKNIHLGSHQKEAEILPHAWIYDPMTKTLHTGNGKEWHGSLLNKIDPGYKRIDRYVYGWFNYSGVGGANKLAPPVSVYSDNYGSEASPEEKEEGLKEAEKYYSLLQKTAGEEITPSVKDYEYQSPGEHPHGDVPFAYHIPTKSLHYLTPSGHHYDLWCQLNNSDLDTYHGNVIVGEYRPEGAPGVIEYRTPTDLPEEMRQHIESKWPAGYVTQMKTDGGWNILKSPHTAGAPKLHEARLPSRQRPFIIDPSSPENVALGEPDEGHYDLLAKLRSEFDYRQWENRYDRCYSGYVTTPEDGIDWHFGGDLTYDDRENLEPYIHKAVQVAESSKIHEASGVPQLQYVNTESCIGHQGRVPFLWDPDRNVIYVGNEGSSHYNFLPHVPLSDITTENAGVIFNGNIFFYGNEPAPEFVEGMRQMNLRFEKDKYNLSAEPANNCNHNWVDMRNEVVQNGSWCPNCGTIRGENKDT